MRINKPVISIIIVQYKVKEALFECLKSIYDSNIKVHFEVIIVDNDEAKTIKLELLKKFKNVRYVENKINNGWGGGVNLGARHARGEYLYLLNPDTLIFPKTIDSLYYFVQKHKKIGVASSLILDPRGNPHLLQGTGELTPFLAIILYSFINKWLPNNYIAKRFWAFKTLNNSPQKVSIATLTGALVRKYIFEKVGMLDEKLFLYFEEHDLGNRINKLGLDNYIVPESKIIHIWGLSSRKINDINKVFIRSRFYYFKKHYGLLSAIIVNGFLGINKHTIFLGLIIIVSALLNFQNLSERMVFIGDQGWFYLSARDLVLTGQIPLVGIASSHPWLHQGPLWTYMLAITFWFLGFNPLNGGYLASAIGAFSVFLMYKFGKEMFSERVGFISAALYATSPLIISHSQMPYHTSPIPLFTLLFIYSLYKWIKGNTNFFPLSIFFLAILYNFELTTSALLFILLTILSYGMFKKKEWTIKLINKKIAIYSIIAFLVPMLPIIIYDFNHNFLQTIGFAVWIGYKILRFFGFSSIYGKSNLTAPNLTLDIFFGYYQKIIFIASSFVSFVILAFSSITLLISILMDFKKKTYAIESVILVMWLIVPLFSFFINKTLSDAHLPILFPALIFLTAFSLNLAMKRKKLVIPVIIYIVIAIIMNSYHMISYNNSTIGINYSKRLSTAREIVEKAKGKEYNIVGVGQGSQFESFTMNYEYLLWWLGHAPSKTSQSLKFMIRENEDTISLKINES